MSVLLLSTPQALEAMRTALHHLRTVQCVQIFVYSTLQDGHVVQQFPLREIIRRLLFYPHERLDKLLEFRFDFRTQYVSFTPALTHFTADARVEKLAAHAKEMRKLMLKTRSATRQRK